MRFFLLLLALNGCASGPVRSVKFVMVKPDHNMVLACAYTHNTKALVCADPETFLLIAGEKK